MGFVKTAAELEQIQRVLASPRWTGEWLAVRFTTEPETIARLLPPPLEAGPEPLATATIGRWQSHPLGDFAGGVLNFAATHDGVDGWYALAMYMDVEPPIVFGRDVFGEPKKLAKSGLFRDGDHVHAWIERHGVRLIDLRAELGNDLGASRSERHTFNYKARTDASGWGLEEDAILTRTHFTVQMKSERRGEGKVELRSGPHDPLGEVAVVEVRSATLGQDDSFPSCQAVASVDPATFLPYHYGRQDDWLALSSGGYPSAAAGTMDGTREL
jgi:acetoacetate decarboxylase